MTTIPLNKIRREDLLDTDFIDAVELSSDGYLLYRIADLISTNLSTSTVTINPSSSLDLLDYGEQIIESLDRVLIYGTPEADGYYIIDQILNSSSFTVFGILPNSTDGYINFYYPSGASKVGIDSSNLQFTDATNIQKALEDLSVYLDPTPVAVEPGYYIMDDEGNLIVV